MRDMQIKWALYNFIKKGMAGAKRVLELARVFSFTSNPSGISLMVPKN